MLYFFFGLEAAKLSKVVRKRVLAATEKEYGLPGGFLEKALSGAEGKLSTELFVNLLREVRAAKGPRTERLVYVPSLLPCLPLFLSLQKIDDLDFIAERRIRRRPYSFNSTPEARASLSALLWFRADVERRERGRKGQEASGPRQSSSARCFADDDEQRQDRAPLRVAWRRRAKGVQRQWEKQRTMSLRRSKKKGQSGRNS